MKINSGHLTYCSNIYSGESWEDHFDALKKSFPLIKQQVSPDEPMGLGLRLSNLASIDLITEGNLKVFRQWLTDNQCYVFTMNGFPFGGFHHTRVKDQVHAPDWTTKERLDYTLRLFHILTKLLPEDMEGGISTSPLSYKPWFNNKEKLAKAKALATENILLVADELHAIRQRTGILLHLDIEPEPDGFLESGREFINWFENDLLIKGIERFRDKLKISAFKAETILRRHIGLCYDVCHFAIGYEPHAEIIQELTSKKIKVGKIQISAALKARVPQTSGERQLVFNEFSRFNESTYLHQVIAKSTNGDLIRYPDLPDALSDSGNPDVAEWRAHFHVPVFNGDFGLLKSTQSDIVQVLEIFSRIPFTHHLEVETYTWDVLPEALKLPLNQSVIRELEWVRSIL
ncbi:MAG TPA: metabolite traffic protein EboE [Sphingobacteriaceae bacterium]|nr:metabolite traffic protein EboE [Sphingobacteriaceae bacterium]